MLNILVKCDDNKCLSLISLNLKMLITKVKRKMHGHNRTIFVNKFLKKINKS